MLFSVCCYAHHKLILCILPVVVSKKGLLLAQVVQLLQSFKTSNNAHEQEVFACMIHNLFDEYRFFPRYPDKVSAVRS